AARGGGAERERIVLLAPDGELVVGVAKLGGEDAIESELEAGGGLLAESGGDDGVGLVGAGDVAEQLEQLGHGVVVERDAVVITAEERIHLRESTIWILRGEDVAEAAFECSAPVGGVRVSGAGGDHL